MTELFAKIYIFFLFYNSRTKSFQSATVIEA